MIAFVQSLVVASGRGCFLDKTVSSTVIVSHKFPFLLCSEYCVSGNATERTPAGPCDSPLCWKGGKAVRGAGEPQCAALWFVQL